MNIRKGVVAAVFAFMVSFELHAQGPDIANLKTTSIKPMIANVFVYGAGSCENHGNLWTAANSLGYNKDLYGKYSDIGAGMEFYRENGWLQFSGSLGYKYKNYSYDKKFISDSGIESHWLTTDLKTELRFMGVGIKSDVFLHSRRHSSNNFDHNGIYPGCFNPMTLCWYYALHARFTRLKAEVRIGSYIVPHLNASKLSYYNLTTTYVEALYWEIKLSFRIFTTGSPFNAPSYLSL